MSVTIIIVVITLLITSPFWFYLLIRLGTHACFKSWKEVFTKPFKKENKNGS